MQKQHEEEKKILEDEKETILLKHKIKEEKTLNEKIQSERFLLKRNIINDLYSKVDVQIKNYEENIIRVFLDILTKHDIKMDAKELSSYIKNAMYNYYKDEQIDKSRQNGLLRAIDIYKNKHTEEQKNRMDTEEKYEQMVRNLKKKHISEINEIKNNILEDVNLLIQKYRTISLKLLNITNKKELEKKKITEICVSACKQFEDDVKDKAKISMEEYKSHIMYSVNKIKEEKHNLEKKM
ncbi:hypothetical protein PFBG_01403 [Plasmodium falciparum 7G8]|uniref:Uncharacterized protein n=1 Tax=Plasmodium falciparum (isolate 7G8) TaxID=57266 RepID=W7FGT0_PLAF8|nr:hypothetical protein PFBG_01403 [Plasmodium falciparum 7G8]